MEVLILLKSKIVNLISQIKSIKPVSIQYKKNLCFQRFFSLLMVQIQLFAQAEINTNCNYKIAFTVGFNNRNCCLT